MICCVKLSHHPQRELHTRKRTSTARHCSQKAWKYASPEPTESMVFINIFCSFSHLSIELTFVSKFITLDIWLDHIYRIRREPESISRKSPTCQQLRRWNVVSRFRTVKLYELLNKWFICQEPDTISLDLTKQGDRKSTIDPVNYALFAIDLLDGFSQGQFDFRGGWLTQDTQLFHRSSHRGIDDSRNRTGNICLGPEA